MTVDPQCSETQKIPQALTVRPLGTRTADKEVVWLDVTVDEVLFVDGLNTGYLEQLNVRECIDGSDEVPTICLAAMQTVLVENFRPHMSKRSSKLGPRRSMTRMLCNPSCPKW